MPYHEYYHSHRYDSHLISSNLSTRQNAILLITARVRLEPMSYDGEVCRNSTQCHLFENGNGNGEPTEVPIFPWVSYQWNEYKRRVKREIETYFNGENQEGIMWLKPDSIEWNKKFCFTEGGQIYIPNIRCSLRVDIVNTPNAHITYYCYNTNPANREVDYAGTNPDHLSGFLTNNSVELMHGPIQGSNYEYRQIPVVHEFGHYLGMDHVACPASTLQCYLGTGNQAEDLMGIQMGHNRSHARPWQVRLARHFGSEIRTEVFLRRIMPERLR